MADLPDTLISRMAVDMGACMYVGSTSDMQRMAREIRRQRAAALNESERCHLLSIRAVLAGKRPLFNAEILTLDRLLAASGAKP